MVDKPGRNEPCHCGSGRKYKKCCLVREEAERLESARQRTLWDDDDAKDLDEDPPGIDDEVPPFDYGRITIVRYERGFVARLEDAEREGALEISEWSVPDIPPHVLECLERERVDGAVSDAWLWPGIERRVSVCQHLFVDRHQSHPFVSCLHDQEPIEGVPVHGLQRVDAGRMTQADGQRRQVVGLESPRDIGRDGLGQRQLAQASLDGHFPHARGREENVVARMFNLAPRARRQALGLGVPPQPDVSVEQQLQGSKSSRTVAGSGASKSSGSVNTPRSRPATLLARGGRTLTIRATGLPSLAMTISSPASTRARSFERCVLASWTLTVGILED